MLITSDYLAMQKALHDNASYGTSGRHSAELVKEFNDTDILDYGCGKRTLEAALGFDIANYDPAIEGLEHNNQPHNIVFCGDVLEHIEPELLDDVLRDIKRCTLKKAILIACTVPAKKTLPDGRNAHLILKDANWWYEKVKEHFTVIKYHVTDKNVKFLVE